MTDDATVRVDPAGGGRIASLEVDGVELLSPRLDAEDWLRWGCFPMVPWAGRIREGRFSFGGVMHQLEVDFPPHAIHGVGYRAGWEADGPSSIHLDLGKLWPFGGRVEQHVELGDRSLMATMSVHAVQRMPVMAGWHPCFRRRLSRGDEAELAVTGGYMWERDVAGIPTGKRVPSAPGPWDDCFDDVSTPPVVRWPGFGSIRLESNMASWVVYSEAPDLFCIEPQTDAPDSFNRDPMILEPGQSLDVWMRISWELE